MSKKLPISQIQDFLAVENARNRQSAALFTKLIQSACEGSCEVIIGHHLTFEFEGRLETENEIPSADTLLFNHEFMTAVFGEEAITVMVSLAKVPCGQRDTLVAQLLSEYRNTERYAAIDSGS